MAVDDAGKMAGKLDRRKDGLSSIHGSKDLCGSRVKTSAVTDSRVPGSDGLELLLQPRALPPEPHET